MKHNDDSYVPTKPTGRGIPKPGESLAELNPELAAQWHPSRNGGVRPGDVTLKSGLKVWWLCSTCCHEWVAVVASRSNGRGCPGCSGRSATTTNNLASTHPHLLKEWRPEQEGELSPYEIKAGSGQKVRWKREECQHQWVAVVRDRARGDGCPVCSAKVVTSENCLQTTHPSIASEWHHSINCKSPDEVVAGSAYLAHWECHCGNVWQARVCQRTTRGRRCPRCAIRSGRSYWTRKRLQEFINDLKLTVDGAGGALSQAQIYVLCQQAGVDRSKKLSKLIQGGRVADLEQALQELGDNGSDDAVVLDDDSGEDQEDVLPADASPEIVDEVEEQPSASGEPERADDQTNGPGELPTPDVGSVLAASETLLAYADEEAAEYLIASQVADLWRAAYENLEAADAATAEPRSNGYQERVRAQFRTELDQALAIVPPEGWSFRPGGPGTSVAEPSLMQKHVANQVVRRRRYGNWSGTGAGKTVSAVLAARLLNAGVGNGVNVVVCPNNTVDGWSKVIRDCYPDSRVVTKTLTPSWGRGDGPRWLVLNVEAFQQRAAGGELKELLGRDDIRVDMVVLDEIHSFKHRHQTRKAEKDESKRRKWMKWLLVEAVEQNPEVAVLGMSATPLVNDLTEGRSILDMVVGVEHDDLPTRSTVENCVRMHQRFVLTGTRFIPQYEAELDEHRVTVACDHLLDEIRGLGKNVHPASLEKILLEPKLATIVNECVAAKQSGKRVFVYSYYVEDVFGPIAAALEGAGLRVGVFNGEDKDGLFAFTGIAAAGNPVADADRVDVLIGSPAIGTGVDGLQHVTDTLIFATLPWTAADYQQVVGRVHRQGQTAHKVRVVIPVTVAYTEIVNGVPWSWCRRRAGVLKYKKTIADAVLDGTIPEAEHLSQEKVTRSIVKWLHRLDTDGEITVERRPLTADEPETIERDTETAAAAGRRAYGEFSKVNNRWNRAKSQTTHTKLQKDPVAWHDYHAMYRKARIHWPVIPAQRFAGMLNERRSHLTVADLGCGEMLLAHHAADWHRILGFDHVAVDDRVTVCDIANVPLEDQSVNVSVLSLALMGRNCSDYLTEAWRITEVDGFLWLAEPTSRIGDDRDRITEALADHGFDVSKVEVIEPFTYVQAVRSTTEPVTGPRSLLV